jgi:hypothetical protein
MMIKKWLSFTCGCIIVASQVSARDAAAQDKDVQLNAQNRSKQPLFFTITTKQTPQGQHFVVKVDPKSQEVKFLGARLSINDESLVESNQMKGVYSRRTIAVCTLEKVIPQGEEKKAVYGFFVSSKNLEHSTFSLPVASLNPKWSVTHYWFFLKDFVPTKQSSAVKKAQPRQSKQARGAIPFTFNGQTYYVLPVKKGKQTANR